eukprot:CAMPEP_0176133712 /NCGR_PEP_ID=MMETSP0120_2-20121206/67793_1 /TAXON_ID=160619 /ORGANISM="Kryptoperidinium foliaceum, Strain CCMP 1326" /LENGTH=133 /DNA_ID=CAMNT_0017469319 /DNA_START=1 /DNA_END=399 /DNA_ORIENTATION=+
MATNIVPLLSPSSILHSLLQQSFCPVAWAFFHGLRRRYRYEVLAPERQQGCQPRRRIDLVDCLGSPSALLALAGSDENGDKPNAARLHALGTPDAHNRRPLVILAMLLAPLLRHSSEPHRCLFPSSFSPVGIG